MRQTSLLQLRRALVALMLALTLCSFVPPRRAQAAAGALDPTFGAGGKVQTSFYFNFAGAQAVVSRSDGHLYAGGYSDDPSGNSIDFALASYDVNGKIDPAFGTNGKVTTSFFGFVDQINALVLQSDGKILAAGSAQDSLNSPHEHFALARYNSNGTLDTTFGNGGKVTTHIPGRKDVCHAIALQSDGKIVAVGETSDPNENLVDFLIARYNANGTLDTSFGTGGLVENDLFGSFEVAFGLVIQPNGRIVVVGSGGPLDDANGVILVRYNADGTMDTTFGTGGKVHEDFGLGGQGLAIALQSDGKILAGGYADNIATHDDFGIARFLSNGQLDTSFGTGGKTFTDFGYDQERINHLIIQPDGRVVAAGTAANPRSFQGDFAVVRYNSDGSLDQSFGAGGKVLTDFSGSWGISFGVTLQPNGRIVVAGQTTTIDVSINFALAGYDSGGLIFDRCIQDDSSQNSLQINSLTGDYRFVNCGGVAIGGTAKVTRQGNLLTLQDNVGDRRVLARIDLNTHQATASVQLLATGKTFTILDRNTTNNTCGCK